ncbi:MAG: pilus assembly protein TadG-related protein [Jhaorihella sp.]
MPVRDTAPWSRTAAASGVRPGAGFARRFLRDEDGTLIIFGIFAFVIMLMVAGIGVDLMQFERNRSNLQSTMDRAVLAAADLDQKLDPQAVVNDYLAKAGLSEYLSNVTVESGIGYRIVSATAEGSFETQFMKLSGVETLTMPAATTAEERIDGVEISLVLDVSGSMNSNSRLTNLKSAAKDFIDQMVENSTDGNLSISIIPYATQVSLPDYMISQFNVSTEHAYSNCVNFSSADFNSASMNPAAPLSRTMHFDPWNDFDGRDNDPKELVGLDSGLNRTLPVCEALSSREILPLSKNATVLKNYIDAFMARGNTSLDVGMKWGTALLDPSLKGVVSSMVSSGNIDAAFSDRPANYDDGDTLKVIVLMTDGQNTSQYYINDGYRSGDSNIWWNDQEEKYSVYVGLDADDDDGDGITGEPLFYWPFDNTWHDHAYGEGTYDETVYERECTSYRRSGSCRRYRTVATTVTVDEPGSAAILSYADLWAYTTMESVVEDLYEPWMNDSEAWNDWYYSVRNYVNSNTKDARTKAICDAAKEQDIIVFTIGFEAPWSGKQVIKDCASSNSHFFDVNGLEIADAFSSIASSIRKLRLTQ